jgi:nitrogen-specific signal transduction histidine kinase
MAQPDRMVLEQFEHLCHQVSNPLMVISGQAYLLDRAIRRLPHLPEHECTQLTADLAHISNAVRSMAADMDAYREKLTELEGPP